MTTKQIGAWGIIAVAAAAVFMGMIPPLLNAHSTLENAVGVGLVIALALGVIMSVHWLLTGGRKQGTKVLVLLLASMSLPACTWGKIEPGHIGVVVPLSGSEKGTLETASNGWYMYSFNTQVYEFPVYNQQHTWTAAQGEGKQGVDERLWFADKDGLKLGADVGVQFHVPTEHVTTLFREYRQDLDHIRDTVLKNAVRNALNMTAQGYRAEEMFGDKRGEFFTKVQRMVHDQMAPHGLEVSDLFLVGELQLPEQIKATIQAKLQATMVAQQKENEKRAVEAEAAKLVAQAEGAKRVAIATAEGEAAAKVARAKAEADANGFLERSLTPNVLAYKRAQWEYEVRLELAKNWKGGVPATVLPGQTNSPFLYDIRGLTESK